MSSSLNCGGSTFWRRWRWFWTALSWVLTIIIALLFVLFCYGAVEWTR